MQGRNNKEQVQNEEQGTNPEVNVPVARLIGTPNTEPRLRGVDKLYRGERVATSRTSTQNVRERNIGGQ
jgi:hypothetical protein